MRGTEILYHYRYIHFTVNKTYLLKYHCTLTLSNTCNSIRMSPIKIKLLQKIYKTTKFENLLVTLPRRTWC